MSGVAGVEPGGKESLRRHLAWLYTGKDAVYSENAGTPCLCEHAFKGLGRVYGMDMGKGWVRMTTNPNCVHHGTKAEKERKERQRKAGR